MSLLIALISAVSFFFIPYLIGNLITKNRNSIVSNFIVGSLIHFVLSFIIYFLRLSSIYPYLIGLITFISLICFLINLKIKLSFSQFIIFLTIFLISCLSYYIYRFNTAYPLPLNWDFFHHQTLVNQILSGRLSLLTSNLSDTFIFNGYTPLFHLLLALPQMIFHPDVLQYFWWLEFFFALVVNFTVYFLSLRIFRHLYPAIIAVVFSAFIFESHMAYTTLMLLPQTLTALCFAAILNQKFRFRFHYYQLIFLFLLHYIMGIFSIIFIITRFLINRFKSQLNQHRLIDTLNLVSLSLLAVTTLYRLPLNLNFLNSGEAAAFDLTVSQKMSYFYLFSGYFTLIFLALGFIFITFFNRRFLYKKYLLLTILSIYPVILPFPYALKFLVISHYLIVLIMAYGFFRLTSPIRSDFLKSLILPLYLAALSFVLYSSANSFKNTLNIGESIAYISLAEVQVAKFLKDSYDPATTLLISDPATSQILEPLSGINTPGGAYMNAVSRHKLIAINNNFSPNQIKNIFTSVADSKTSPPKTYLVALSSRYFRWQSQSDKDRLGLAFNIWAPGHLSLQDQSYISWLSAQNGFKLAFQNSDLAILELTP